MRYIEPHAHMVSRVTDDYQMMALAGCKAITEPAFWAGFDRGSVNGFRDYFQQITEFEPRRAAHAGIPHYCWICMNPKECENKSLAQEVLEIIPEFLQKPTVLGIGEIGLNKNTSNELELFHQHLDLAVRFDQMILIHTPHLEDKRKGTQLILESLRQHSKIDPKKVLIDHVEEHTVPLILSSGFWAGITLYPESKCTPARAIDIVELYSTERVLLNCACDWGASDPLAVPKTGREMIKRGHSPETVDRLLFQNPLQFLSQNPKFIVAE